MREIKFRVWNNFGKRMLYDSSLEIKGNAIVSKFAMQFTGLKDKRNEDIFEGDIILINRGIFPSKIDIVVFEKGAFMCNGENLSNWTDKEIIGNKFQQSITTLRRAYRVK